MSTQMSRSTANEWGNVWHSWDGSVATRDVWWIIDSRKHHYLRRILPPTGRSLEVGCGSARLSSLLAAEGYETFCLDFSLSALEAARRNYAVVSAPGQFTLGDALGLPFQDDTFDVVLSAGLLEHFENPQPIVDEMVRVLKPGGLFYSDIVPKKLSLFRSLNFLTLGGTSEKAMIYERPITREEMYDLVRRAGCREDIRIIPMSVLLPQKLFSRRVFRSGRLEYLANKAVLPLFGRLDGTRIADWLGFLYFVYGYKDGAAQLNQASEPPSQVKRF